MLNGSSGRSGLTGTLENSLCESIFGRTANKGMEGLAITPMQDAGRLPATATDCMPVPGAVWLLDSGLAGFNRRQRG